MIPKRRKPPNHGRNGPGVMGRPKADAALVARAIELVDAGTHVVKDACEEVGIGEGTLRRALAARRAAEEQGDAPALVTVGAVEGFHDPSADAPRGSSVALSTELVEDALSPADPERAAAIRALVVRGTLPGTNAKGELVELPVDFGPDWVARVAEGEGITTGEVRRLLREAAVQARLDALPFEVARERSIAVAEKFLRQAEDAHDGRSGLDAQRHIDRLRFLEAPPDPDGLTRAEVTIVLRRVASELSGVAGGVDALRRALAGA